MKKKQRKYPYGCTNTAWAQKIICKFQSEFDSLLNQTKLALSMLVNVLGHSTVLGVDIPASIFRNLDYSGDFEVPEDGIVLGEAFKKIKGGYIEVGKLRRIRLGDFTLQYNPIRGLRPKRDAKKKDVPFNPPFDRNAFHYGRPECEPEVFYSLTWDSGLKVDLLFNRYPFAPYHFLWVPDRKGQHNQFLDPQKDTIILEAAYDFVIRDGLNSSLRLSYNSMGAHASVNHLHFQGFVSKQEWELPFDKIIHKHIQNSGNITGTIHWHLSGTQWISVSDGVKGLKDFIDKMNADEQPYHLYITPLGIACFPRKHQGDSQYYQLLTSTDFTTGFAFFEMLGEIVSPTPDVFDIDPDYTNKRIKELYRALEVV